MAFNPTLPGRKSINIGVENNLIETFTKASNQKNLVEEIKSNQEVNHKSNIYKIIKNNSNLTKEEATKLTIMIDEYYSKQ